MNIVHLVESLDLGGLERVVVSLAGAQRRQGHAVTIVCLFHPGPMAAEARELGVEVVACGKRSGLDWQALRAIRGVLRDRGAEVLHTHNPIPHYYGVASALGLHLGCIVNTRHGMGSFPFSLKREGLYRLAMAGSNYGVSVCRAAQESFVARGIIPRGKAVTIANGIDLAPFGARNRETRRRVLAGIGCSDESVVFGTVGRLNAAKDHATLLQAMKRLCEGGTDARLVIVGDGECRPALEALRTELALESAVHFLGARKDVPAMLAGFDVFVLSSRTEGYSLALVEAAAAALPIVATDVGGNSDIVDAGTSGILVPAGDPLALTEAMAKLADDAAQRELMGAAGRRWALHAGTLEAMVGAYEVLYRDGRSRSGRRHRDPEAHPRAH